MAKYNPISDPLEKRLRTNAISLALETRDILAGQLGKAPVQSSWVTALKTRFPELSYTDRVALQQIASKSRQSAAISNSANFDRAKAGSLIPTPEGFDFGRRTGGRIRYQMEVTVRNTYRGKDRLILLNVYTNTAKSADELTRIANRQLGDRLDASPRLKRTGKSGKGIREGAEVYSVKILGILSE